MVVPRLVFGGVWGPLGPVFGATWPLLGTFWALLGASALPLGLLLGASRCSWPHLGSLGCLCARFWGVLGASWLGFGELWGSFRYHFRRRCAHCCRDPSMAFTLAFRYLLAARRYVRSTWNRCRKRIVFQHRFFRVSASILEGLGPPTWNQIG